MSSRSLSPSPRGPSPLREDHLLPLLRVKEAARLGRTCKALRGVVREHFRSLGRLNVRKLQAALTTFPRARSLTLKNPTDSVREDSDDGREEVEGDEDEDEAQPEKWGDAQGGALVAWLRAGGHGGEITTVTTGVGDDDIDSLVLAALRRGALPSLKNVAVALEDEAARAAILTRRLLRGMHEVRLSFVCDRELAPQLAALGLVRQLPALARLELRLYSTDYDEDDEDAPPPGDVQWPPFIPPLLKALHIEAGVWGQSLWRALPGMLGASGAALERLEIGLPHNFDAVGDGLVYLAQALRCCSPTLKSFHLSAQEGMILVDPEDFRAWRSTAERLRVQWAELLAALSACRELQVLVLPDIQVEHCFPPGSVFNSLTHLDISVYEDEDEDEDAPDAHGVGLWEVWASGGLPALAKLKVTLIGEPAGDDLKVSARMAPALEAVAGTLTHLDLVKSCIPRPMRTSELEGGYMMGVAVGKLRRLRDLTLRVSEDGRVYHAFAKGLAASGGARPLPLLWAFAKGLAASGGARPLPSPPSVAGEPDPCNQRPRRPAGEPAPPECAGLPLDP
jgi:hypothetical protein